MTVVSASFQDVPMFDVSDFQVTPKKPQTPEQQREEAQRVRIERQRVRIEQGGHPLQPIVGRTLKLHVEAAPVDDKTADGRRCGNCEFRVGSGWNEADGHYPKCWYGWEEGSGEPPPRYTRTIASDVRSWWPACTDHQWKKE